MSDANYFGAVGKGIDPRYHGLLDTLAVQSAASQSAVREGIAIGRRELAAEVKAWFLDPANDTGINAKDFGRLMVVLDGGSQ